VKRNWLLPIAALALAVAASMAARAEDYVEKQSGIHFPDNLAGFKRVEVTPFDQPELGVAVDYQKPGLAKLSIYVYDLGEKQIGTGINPVVRSHFRHVKEDVFTFGRMGRYVGVKLVSEGEDTFTTPSGPLKALWAQLSYSQAEDPEHSGKQTSYAALTGYHGKFLKVRCTWAASRAAEGEKARQAVTTSLAKLLK
jgi:hypothetical protein